MAPSLLTALVLLALIGGAAGFVTHRVLGRRAGLAANLALGMIGAFAVGLLLRSLGQTPASSFAGTVVVATIGALALVVSFRLFAAALGKS